MQYRNPTVTLAVDRRRVVLLTPAKAGEMTNKRVAQQPEPALSDIAGGAPPQQQGQQLGQDSLTGGNTPPPSNL